MDKKDVNDFVQGLVEQVAKDMGIPEKAARAFVGTTLMQNRDNILGAINKPQQIQMGATADAA
jgi:hypothetical protein